MVDDRQAESQPLAHRAIAVALALVNMGIAALYLLASARVLIGTKNEIFSVVGESGPTLWTTEMRVFSAAAAILSVLLFSAAVAVIARRKYRAILVTCLVLLGLLEVYESLNHLAYAEWGAGGAATYMPGPALICWAMFNYWCLRKLGTR